MPATPLIPALPVPLYAVAGDNHLAPCAWTRHPDLAGDSYYSFEQLVDFCVMQQLPLLLLGDVFDTAYPDPMTVWWAVHLLSRLDDRANHYIQGQHERQQQRPWLALADHSHHAHKDIWARGFIFYGLDWQLAAQLRAELVRIPDGIEILLAHQVWGGLMGQVAAYEAELKDIPRVRCVLTGDYHVHKAFSTKGADGQDLLVVSPGSQCMQSIDEPENKAFWVLYSDLTVRSIPPKTRRVYRHVFHHATNFERELEALAARVEPRGRAGEHRPADRRGQVRRRDRRRRQAASELAPWGKAHLFLSPLPIDGRGQPEMD